MISIYQILIGFLLTFILPVLTDFVVGFVRLRTLSPSKNPISSSNARAVKAIFSQAFVSRVERSGWEYVYLSLFNAANIAAFSLSVFYYDAPSSLLDAQRFLICLITYTSFSLTMRFLASLYGSPRVNFSYQLDKLLFSLVSFFLVFVGLGVSVGSGGFGLGDTFMVLAAQPLLYLAFKRFFYSEGRSSRFEKSTEAAFRISFNFALYSFFALIAFSTIGREHMFFGLAASLAVEVLMEVFSFETSRAEKELSASIERFLILALSTSVGIKVFL